MLKRHIDQLYARFDELYVNGTSFISWGELYHWFNKQRLHKTFYAKKKLSCSCSTSSFLSLIFVSSILL